jgi:ketosteroid isomerase-like protein
MTDPARLRAFAESYAAAWCSMDPAQVAAHYAPDASIAINDGEPAYGRPGVEQVAQGFYDAFPDMRVVLDDLIIRDNAHAEFHWTFTGTNTGPGGTGNSVQITGHEVWTIGPDGLLAASHGHFDEAEYARQLEQGV